MSTAEVLDKVYEPHQVEKHWYQYWLDKGYSGRMRTAPPAPSALSFLPQRDRLPAHGPCPEQHPAGYHSQVQADVRL